MKARALVAILGVVLDLGALSCGTRDNDAHFDAGLPSPIGTGSRIREVSNPALENHPKHLDNVNVTGATVTLTDTFDETNNGKSRGNIYVQDVNSQEPFSGMTLFSPTFIPGDLKVAPGDVLDLNGQYQEIASLGTAIFPAGEFLPEIAKPISTFRFEYKAPEPRVIDAADLEDYAKGRGWIGMLVTIQNVTMVDALADSRKTGRVSAHLSSIKNAQLVNELYDLKEGAFPAGTHFASITGIVTYFFTLHIAPRSAADLVK